MCEWIQVIKIKKFIADLCKTKNIKIILAHFRSVSHEWKPRPLLFISIINFNDAHTDARIPSIETNWENTICLGACHCLLPFATSQKRCTSKLNWIVVLMWFYWFQSVQIKLSNKNRSGTIKTPFLLWRNTCSTAHLFSFSAATHLYFQSQLTYYIPVLHRVGRIPTDDYGRVFHNAKRFGYVWVSARQTNQAYQCHNSLSFYEYMFWMLEVEKKTMAKAPALTKNNEKECTQSSILLFYRRILWCQQ